MNQLFERLRKYVFWFFDLLKGQPVRNHYNDIKYIMMHSKSHKSEMQLKVYLKELLLYAARNTDYYHDFAGNEDISSFPIVNKEIIRSDYSKFLSRKFRKTKLKKVTTSGSTGTPFTIYQDRNKVNRHIADNIYFNEQAGHDLGARLYYFRIWNRSNKKRLHINWMQNIKMVDAISPDSDYMESIISKLRRDRSTKSLLAYSSTYEPLSKLISRLYDSGVNFNVKSVITMSEALMDRTRHDLKEIFKCPVVSRYSTMENGFIAQQCIEDNSEYHINTASFFVEVLEIDRDEPVKQGKLGRIVVTDLFNYAMPIIRYDTGDIGILNGNSNCSLKTAVLSTVQGRRVDQVYDTNGHQISPHVVTNTMWPYNQVKQFQFIQESRSEYRMVLNLSEGSSVEESLLIAALKKYLGDEAVIDISYVNEIPQLASGKRKYIVNSMNLNS